jgi:hypothetical protein
MRKITLTVTTEELHAMMKARDVWSEIVFQPGYEIAPTFSLDDISETEETLSLVLPSVPAGAWSLGKAVVCLSPMEDVRLAAMPEIMRVGRDVPMEVRLDVSCPQAANNGMAMAA